MEDEKSLKQLTKPTQIIPSQINKPTTEDEYTLENNSKSEIIASERLTPIQFIPSQIFEPQTCECNLLNQASIVCISDRKKRILSISARTENYLREHRIPELIKFILAKIIASGESNPVIYTATLIDQCMIFRAGHGHAPVIFEDRHLEAVVKSFDPSERGWLSAGQVRRAFTTLCLTLENENDINLDERIPTNVVLTMLRETQEKQLYDLLNAGI